MNRIKEIKARLRAATPGKWVYTKRRHTHDYCIHVANAMEQTFEIDGEIYHDYQLESKDGVVGSSEWIWIKDEDAEFIAYAKEDIEYLLDSLRKILRRVQDDGFTGKMHDDIIKFIKAL